MSTKEKLLEKIMEIPCRKDITIDEIITVAKQHSLEITEGANHMKIVDPITGTVISIPRHDKTVKPYLIKEFQQLLLEKKV